MNKKVSNVTKVLSTTALLGTIGVAASHHDADAATGNAPEISAQDQTVQYGGKWDPYKGVKATDKEDGNLTEDVYYDAPYFTGKTPGSYDVTYGVWDSDDNNTETKSKVTVLNQGEKPNEPSKPEQPSDDTGDSNDNTGSTDKEPPKTNIPDASEADNTTPDDPKANPPAAKDDTSNQTNQGAQANPPAVKQDTSNANQDGWVPSDDNVQPSTGDSGGSDSGRLDANDQPKVDSNNNTQASTAKANPPAAQNQNADQPDDPSQITHVPGASGAIGAQHPAPTNVDANQQNAAQTETNANDDNKQPQASKDVPSTVAGNGQNNAGAGDTNVNHPEPQVTNNAQPTQMTAPTTHHQDQTSTHKGSAQQAPMNNQSNTNAKSDQTNKETLPETGESNNASKGFLASSVALLMAGLGALGLRKRQTDK